MVASLSVLPVIGVPVAATKLEGEDSLLSIVQMPAGVPVATVAIDNATNAGILAAQMLATSDDALRERIRSYKDGLRDKVLAKRLVTYSASYLFTYSPIYLFTQAAITGQTPARLNSTRTQHKGRQHRDQQRIAG
ncbi:MAG: AIR carboxylase family protein [Congregibacter sp.]|nr:AIR carboxylase family protein [Congregibacter sp.]